MTINRVVLEKLRTSASGFATKNHRSYLAEALQCMRETEDPVAALRLLHAMWGSSYADRDFQKAALNDIGKWLEERLSREPAVTHGAIATELGWLRRLSQIADAAREDEHERPPGRRGDTPSLLFGKRIVRIEERRAEAAASARPRSRPIVPEPASVPPPPTHLPPVFQVEFVDFADARKARQTARDREKRGKSPKERYLDLRPVDPRLVPLAAGLVCSTQATEGFDAPFEESQRNAGAVCSFYVTALEERDGRRFARAIALHPPKSGEETAAGATP